MTKIFTLLQKLEQNDRKSKNIRNMIFYDIINPLNSHQNAYINIIYLLKTQNKAL